MTRTWSLYNKEDKLRIDDLRFDQVKTILLAISSNKMRDWFAMQEGEVRWQNIADIPELYEDVREIKGNDYLPQEPAAKPSPNFPAAPSQAASEERRPLFEDAPTGLSESPTLAIDNVQTRERRTARRYYRNLILRAAIGGKILDCETLNISMSGIALRKAVPSEVGKMVNAELVFNTEKLKVACTWVSDTQLKIDECSHWDVLRNWLINW